MNVSTLADNVEHFRCRVLQDALNEALASYWRRRAVMLEGAKPRPDDFHGAATPAELTARWQRLDHEARLCRHRAELSLGGGAPWEDEPTRLA